MSNFLSQEEIDALLNSPDVLPANQNEVNPNQPDLLSDFEKDALGEIGNISMGTAATALSQLLNQRVNITTPKIKITTGEELANSFEVPYMIIDVNFTEGLQGSNLLIIKVSDAAIISDLMMGGDGSNPNLEMTELHASAVGEAMNQMMGSAATSMSTIFQKSVIISPPTITAVNFQQDSVSFPWDINEKIVVVSFKMEIGNLINSEIMQVLPAVIAKEETSMLLGTAPAAAPAVEDAAAGADHGSEEVFSQEEIDQLLAGVGNLAPPEPAVRDPLPPQVPPSITVDGPKNIELILDVPLNISVILGRTKKPIKEVLNLIPGSIVELEKLADEPVEILVNGTLIAHGEVVVVNESFGVRIIAIDSPVQRLNNLRK